MEPGRESSLLAQAQIEGGDESRSEPNSEEGYNMYINMLQEVTYLSVTLLSWPVWLCEKIG